MKNDVESIREVFSTQGYDRTRDTVKLDEYKAPATGQYVYFYKEQDKSGPTQLVIHPDVKLDAFLDLPGITCPNRKPYRKKPGWSIGMANCLRR